MICRNGEYLISVWFNSRGERISLKDSQVLVPASRLAVDAVLLIFRV